MTAGVQTSALALLSLGAGVQSSTLYLMALAGELHVDAAIFADTQWEPAATYRYLEYLEACGAPDGPPIFRVTAGNIRTRTLEGSGRSGRFACLPFHIRNLQGARALGRRQCTSEYKIEPIRRRVRAAIVERLLPPRANGWSNVGITNAVRARGIVVDQLIGISLDEHQRMRTADVAYIRNVYPLVDRRMTRADCLAWLEAHGHPRPPRSACIGCPFRRNREWRALEPAELAEAVDFDRAIRRQLGTFNGDLFLHRDLVPLEMADLTAQDEAAAGFGDECRGMCGN